VSSDCLGKERVTKFVFHGGELSDLVSHVRGNFLSSWSGKDLGAIPLFFPGIAEFFMIFEAFLEVCKAEVTLGVKVSLRRLNSAVGDWFGGMGPEFACTAMRSALKTLVSHVGSGLLGN